VNTYITHQKVPCAPLVLYWLWFEKWSIHYASLSTSTHCTAVHKKYLYNQSSHCKIWTIFGSYRVKSALFAISKDEQNTKEDTSKSMMNALYALGYAKRHKRCWTAKKSSLLSGYACLEASITQSVAQSVSQAVENSIK